MTYVHAISQTIYDYRKLSIRALGFSIVLLLCTYGYLVVSIIFNGSHIEHLEKSMAADSGELSDLEAQYISLKNSISRDEAYALGFVEVENPTYISRHGADSVALKN